MKKIFTTVMSFCLFQTCCNFANAANHNVIPNPINANPANLDTIITNAIHGNYSTIQAFIDDYSRIDQRRTPRYISAAFQIIKELQLRSAESFTHEWCSYYEEDVEKLVKNPGEFLDVHLSYISVGNNDNFIDSYIDALSRNIAQHLGAPRVNLDCANGALDMLRWLKAHPDMLRWLKDHAEELLPREEDLENFA